MMKIISIPLPTLCIILLCSPVQSREAVAQTVVSGANTVDAAVRAGGVYSSKNMHGVLLRADTTGLLMAVAVEGRDSVLHVARHDLVAVTYQDDSRKEGAAIGAAIAGAGAFGFGYDLVVARSNSGTHFLEDGGVVVLTILGVAVGAVIGWFAGSLIDQKHTVDFNTGNDYYRALPLLQDLSIEEEPAPESRKKSYEQLKVRW